MQFLREKQDEAVRAIAGRLCDELLAGKRVLWLVSGGSNIALEVAVLQIVKDTCAERLSGLAVLPIDERYGKPGHADSNVEQLRTAGFDPAAGALIDVLARDLPFDQTVHYYSEVAATVLANADVVVGQFGMGADGHVAGIKPDSPACTDDSATVVGYEWSDYARMTLSAEALKRVTVAYMPAYGADKKPMLQELKKRALPFEKLPAVLLYEIPEVYVYNDQLENKEKQI